MSGIFKGGIFKGSSLSNRSLTGVVPVMTSASQAGFTVSASSEFNSNFAGWKAFDGGVGDWATSGVTQNFWLKVEFPSPKKVYLIDLQGRSDGEPPHYWGVEGSHDNVTWVTLYRALNQPLYQTHGVYNFPLAHSNEAFLYIRFFARFGMGVNPGLQTMQLYEVT